MKCLPTAFQIWSASSTTHYAWENSLMQHRHHEILGILRLRRRLRSGSAQDDMALGVMKVRTVGIRRAPLRMTGYGFFYIERYIAQALSNDTFSSLSS